MLFMLKYKWSVLFKNNSYLQWNSSKKFYELRRFIYKYRKPRRWRNNQRQTQTIHHQHQDDQTDEHTSCKMKARQQHHQTWVTYHALLAVFFNTVIKSRNLLPCQNSSNIDLWSVLCYPATVTIVKYCIVITM